MTVAQKKVLFTSHTANFAKFNRPFMCWFTSQGFVVHYASAGEENVLDCDKHFTIPFERSPFSLNNLRAIFRLKKIIDVEQYDIIHTHTPMGSVVTRLAAMAARKKGTRVIYTAHGFHFFTGAPIMNWLIYYPIEKIMARFTDTLVTINKEDYERANKSFKTNVRYVPGVGIDPNKFNISITKSEMEKLRGSMGVNASDFVMIYVAELSKRKNQLWLIDTLADFIKGHADVHLLLPGQDSLSGKCQQLASKLGLDKQIHFLGYRSDIPQLMKSSDLAVSASRQEGLPVNVMEAMYLGVPVVVTDCRGNRDLIEDGKSGFVVGIDNAKLFVEKIELIYADENARNTIRDVAWSVAQMYVLDNILHSMADVYKREKI